MLGSVFYSAILAILTFLVLRKPHLALVGILSMFGLEQVGQIYLPFLRTHSIFTNVYLILLLALAIALAYRSGSFSLSLTYRQVKVRVFSILLYLYAFLTLAWLPEGIQTNWPATWPYLIVNVVLAPLLVNRLDDLKEIQRTFIWIGGAIVLFLATVPNWGSRSPVVMDTDDVLGVPLSMAQMSGYLLIIATMHFRRTFLSIGLLSVAVVSALVVAVKTGSRGQLIFAILSFALIAPLAWERFSVKNLLQLGASSVSVVAIGVYIFYQTGVYSSRWQTAEMMVDYGARFTKAKTLLTEWFNTPYAILFGLGNSASKSPELVGNYPHIVPLEILGEEGAIGFILFAAVVFLSMKQALRFRSLTFLSKDMRKVYAATFGCFLYTLMVSFKQGSLLNSSIIFLFAVVSEKYYYIIKRSMHLLVSEHQRSKTADSRSDKLHPVL